MIRILSERSGQWRAEQGGNEGGEQVWRGLLFLEQVSAAHLDFVKTTFW